MNRYLYIIIGALVGGWIFSSCHKNLEANPFDRISDEIVWNNKANAQTFIYGTYGGIMNSFRSGIGFDAATSSDLTQYDVKVTVEAIYRETITNRSDYGFNNWAAVRRCNLIIQNVGASSGISDADKAPLIAEAKFLRGMSYFQIARRTGRIVWIDKVLTPEDSLKLPSTANPTESYNYIIKDLEDAVAGLPATKILGRANKYVAAAFLTEVYLQALAYKNYPNPPAVNATDPLLDKIIANAKIVTDGGYALDTDYEGMFNQSKASSSPEIIYAVYNLALNTTVQSTPMQFYMPNMTADKIRKFDGTPLFSPATLFETWPATFPTQNMADDYLVVDKADPTRAVRWDQTSQYQAAVDENVDVMTTYQRIGMPNDKIPKVAQETLLRQGRVKPGSTETFWTLTNTNRDARWAASIVSDSTTFFSELFTTSVKGNATRWISAYGGDWGSSLTNLFWKKGCYTNLNPKFLNTVQTNYHYVCTRLGRVYLNLAEAYLLKGDLPNALLYINKTREFHGKLPPAVAGTLAQAWVDYKRERRVELVHEEDRYYSLLRWGRYGGAANDGIASGGSIAEFTEPIRVMDVSKDRKSFAVFTGAFENGYDQRVFTAAKRYLFPISQNFIDNNPKFGPQNPGW